MTSAYRLPLREARAQTRCGMAAIRPNPADSSSAIPSDRNLDTEAETASAKVPNRSMSISESPISLPAVSDTNKTDPAGANQVIGNMVRQAEAISNSDGHDFLTYLLGMALVEIEDLGSRPAQTSIGSLG